MKKKILFSAFLVTVSIFVYNFYNPESESANASLAPQPTSGDDFLVGCIHSAPYVSINTYYDELGVNLTHGYVGTEWNAELERNTPYCDWVLSNQREHLLDPVPAGAISTKLSEFYSSHNSTVLWMRPKIEWLAYGQSSTYQAEYVSTNDDYWFYSFQVHNGVSMPDYDFNNGDSVLHCSSIELGPNAHYVLTRLKANTEQVKTGRGSNINQWQYDDECTWLVKPRIRIDSNFAHNNPITPVCSIKVIGSDGLTLKNVILNGRNFLDINNNYDGRYIDEYRIFPGDDTLLIHGAWGDDEWVYKAKGNDPSDAGHCKTDIQVYWYGYCNMWIDYVRVDNDVADGLLGDKYCGEYNQWIMEAAGSGYVNILAINPAEFELNNLPYIKYVEKKMKEYSNGRFKIVAER
jgi:hypothetical protein